MNEDLKIIKKKYGEKMMHLCRKLFVTILDNSPGVLPTILLSTFDPSHFLYDDITKKDEDLEDNYIEQFKMYIYSIYHYFNNYVSENKKTVADPKTLMRQAGYTLYECKTAEDIQVFRKYYTFNECLCTFKGDRLKRCYVYFAVRDNADKLKRSNFTKPNRQDEYGTSVISIQFTKDISHTLSIKNRYNHTVSNPDATFSNDLDNIVPGLTQSFSDYYGMEQRNYVDEVDLLEIPGYVRANDGKLYKYNYEIDNVYYCPNNIVIKDFEVTKYAKEKYIVMDYFILDLVNKRFINQLEDPYQDSFTDTILDIKNIKINKINNKKEIIITPFVGEDIIITLNKYNQIIGYKNNNITKVFNYFLRYNETLEDIEIDKVITIGNSFIKNNIAMKHLVLSNVLSIGDGFMINNKVLEDISLPKIISIGDNFCCWNKSLTTIKLPQVIRIGECFLLKNQVLKRAIFPKLELLGHQSVGSRNIDVFYAPSLYIIDSSHNFSKYEINQRTNEKVRKLSK